MPSKTLQPSRVLPVIVTLLIVIAVGVVDYLSGYEISFSVFYLLAVAVAVWYVGPGAATAVRPHRH